MLFHPLLNGLIGLYRVTGDLGWSIIVMTVGLRLAMTPLVLPSLRLGQKMQGLAPQLAKLKEKYKDDKQGLLAAQAQLYKDHGANPASGCLPQIIQLLVLIALFNAFNSVLGANGSSLVDRLNPRLYSFNQLPVDFHLSVNFYYLNLVKPDIFRLPDVPLPLPGLFLILAALVQLVSSKMMLPVAAKAEELAQKTPDQSDDLLAGTQQQMLYLFPLMTVLFGYQFPAGLVLYWLVFSLVSTIQQYYATGWGGLAPWVKRLKIT